MLNLLNGSLALLILGLAIWVIVAREAFAAVAGFMVYGLLLALVWVQLQGIDIALTEAAIGGGLTGVLLIGAVTRLRAAEAFRLRAAETPCWPGQARPGRAGPGRLGPGELGRGWHILTTV